MPLGLVVPVSGRAAGIEVAAGNPITRASGKKTVVLQVAIQVAACPDSHPTARHRPPSSHEQPKGLFGVISRFRKIRREIPGGTSHASARRNSGSSSVSTNLGDRFDAAFRRSGYLGMPSPGSGRSCQRVHATSDRRPTILRIQQSRRRWPGLLRKWPTKTRTDNIRRRNPLGIRIIDLYLT